MKTKRIVAALLASMLIASAFGACQGTQTPSGSSTGESQSVEKEPESQPYTVHVMAIGEGKTQDCQAVADYISGITKDSGIRVQLTRGVTKEQLNLALTSGEKVDLFAGVSWYVTLANLAANGQVLPMNDLLEQHGKETLNAISEADWKCTTIDGQIYGVPMNKDKAQSKNFQMRKDIVDELKIDPTNITNFDELEAVLQQVKAAKPDVYPIVSAGGSIDPCIPFDELSDRFGVLENVFDSSTKVVNLYETPSYKAHVERMWRWSNEGLIMPDATSNTSSLEQILGAGTGFGGFVPSKPGAALQAGREAGVDLVQAQLIAPYSVTSMVAQPYCIPANSQQPEKAMELLNMMYSNPDVSNAFIYGLEGKHYEYVDKENNVVDYAQGITTANTGYSVLGWSWPNQQIGAIWNGDDLDIWQQLNTFNAEAAASPAKGFTWNSAPVLNQVTACENVVSKYKNGLECGTLNPEETLPVMIQEMKDAGIDTIIAQKQTQLDTWLAAQK